MVQRSGRVLLNYMVSIMLSKLKSFCAFVGVLAGLWAAGDGLVWSQVAAAPGKETFASSCANCHGLDGRGGERAPDIAERPRVQQLSDVQLSKIIRDGIQGTGMPAFHSLDSATVKALVSYLRTLQGAKTVVRLPGDPGRGEAIFAGKAGCSGCHMIAGKGGFISSDLSGYARTRTVEQVRRDITNPAPSSGHQGRVATATVHSGEKYTGRVRNEDNFSVQLQTLDGAFHFLAKSDLEGFEYSSQPLMPSDYGATLSASELNDLVSYLMRVAGADGTNQSKASDKDVPEE